MATANRLAGCSAHDASTQEHTAGRDASACSTAFRKHVFPRLASPGQWPARAGEGEGDDDAYNATLRLRPLASLSKQSLRSPQYVGHRARRTAGPQRRQQRGG